MLFDKKEKDYPLQRKNYRKHSSRNKVLSEDIDEFLRINSNEEIQKDKGFHSYSACIICGYVYFSENNNLKGDLSFFKKILYCLKDLFFFSCQTFTNCCNVIICNILNILFYNGKKKCKCICNCCCKYCKYSEKNFGKTNEHYCYFYKVKRNYKWMNEYISSDVQKEIIPYMLEYFLLQFTTIGFEKDYKTLDFISIDKEDINSYRPINFKKISFFNDPSLVKIFRKNLTTAKIFMPTFGFILYICITMCYSRCFKKKRIIRNKNIFGILSTLLLEGIHGILFVNSLISLIFSFLCLFEYKAKIIIYFLIPILLTKFYFFTFNFYCVNISNEQKGYELIMSGSTLISLYLVIWNLILKYLILNNIKNDMILYIIQLVVSFFIFIYFILFQCCCIKCDFCVDEPCLFCDSCDPCDEDLSENVESLKPIESSDINYSII